MEPLFEKKIVIFKNNKTNNYNNYFRIIWWQISNKNTLKTALACSEAE
jgi:hypothetical protein